MLSAARMTVNRAFKIGHIDPRMYAGYVEPLFNTVYGGIFDPEHPRADDMGFRGDVLELVRELGIPAIRLPGGNYVSGYDWTDTVGPLDERKVRLDLAWRQIEPNRFGLNEYLDWAKRAGAEPLLTVNLGTQGISEAAALIEYCNRPGGTYWSDLRRRHGVEDPREIKTWYLGNEMDGPWQIGRLEGRDYGRKAREVAKAMKWVDPTIETIAVGSSSPLLHSHPQWNIDVLEECYELVDYLSIHYYHVAPMGDIPQLLVGSTVMEEFITAVLASCDFVQAKLREPRKLMLSFDEYALAMSRQPNAICTGRGGRIPNDTYYEFSPANLDRDFIDNAVAYQTPDNLSNGGDIIDAVANASAVIALLKHADRIKIGCMTVSLLGAIKTDKLHAWRSATYYTYLHFLRYGRGIALASAVTSPTYSTPGFNLNEYYQAAPYDSVPYVEAVAVHNGDEQTLTVFSINKSPAEDIPFEIDVRDFEGYELLEHIAMESDDLQAENSYEHPEVIVPHAVPVTALVDGMVRSVLKRMSWNVFRLGKG